MAQLLLAGCLTGPSLIPRYPAISPIRAAPPPVLVQSGGEQRYLQIQRHAEWLKHWARASSDAAQRRMAPNSAIILLSAQRRIEASHRAEMLLQYAVQASPCR